MIVFYSGSPSNGGFHQTLSLESLAKKWQKKSICQISPKTRLPAKSTPAVSCSKKSVSRNCFETWPFDAVLRESGFSSAQRAFCWKTFVFACCARHSSYRMMKCLLLHKTNRIFWILYQVGIIALMTYIWSLTSKTDYETGIFAWTHHSVDESKHS